MSFSALSQFLSQVGVLAQLDRRTQQIQSTVNDIHRRFSQMSDTVASEISNQQASVGGLTDAVQRNTTLIQGLNQQLADAIAAAAAAGATPGQLEQLNALNRQINQDTADLAAAAASPNSQPQPDANQTPVTP
jgi:chromosome segregation ATPase